ncbi:unknown protein [Seminavis robusta]|uniref:Uncharacterized protein n=1 Tax=Seminavis robusta TaxID=568900 RepID=A0A9N8DMD6_9STRA|nr:unknown protein [Seminavis robusta]|eukprot:Sro241_g096400.1 n/a (402) ;mRNA; r:54856-56061
MSHYDALILAGLRQVDSHDYAGAKKLFRKAQKLDTRRPQAYIYLGNIFRLSGMAQEYISNMQEAIKHCALLALTGNCIDSMNYIDGYFVDQEESIVLWCKCLLDVCEHYAHVERKELMKPKWFSCDDLLIRVTKVALKYIKEKRATPPDVMYNMSLVRAQALCGIIHNGVHDISLYVDCMLSCRTPQNLLEASAILRSLSTNGQDPCISDFFATMSEGQSRDPQSIRKFFQLEAAKLEAIAGVLQNRKQHTLSNDNELPVIRPHTWVMLLGLVSPSGSAMNRKLGLVCENGLQHGRHLVTVDGYDGIKCIKPKNLVEIPLEEYREALISTLGEEMQWRFMRNLVECEAEPKQEEPNPGKEGSTTVKILSLWKEIAGICPLMATPIPCCLYTSAYNELDLVQ